MISLLPTGSIVEVQYVDWGLWTHRTIIRYEADEHNGRCYLAMVTKTGCAITRTMRHIKVTPLTLDVWNVHTCMDHDRADRPEWRTALIVWKLAVYKVQIAALSETCLVEEGQLTLTGMGYTYFWIGCSKHDAMRLELNLQSNPTWSTSCLTLPRVSMKT